MKFYPTFLTLHIIFAGVWLIYFAVDIVLKSKINETDEITLKHKLMGLYLNFSNLFGIVGFMGIAITGIFLVSTNPGYGYFDMSHAHWLATKQIIFVIILINTFFRIIPAAKKLRSYMESDQEKVNDQFHAVTRINLLINVMVIINFAFAITHRFLG